MRLLSLGHLRSLWLTDTVGRLVLAGTVALVPLVGGTALALPPRTVQRVVSPIWQLLTSPLDGTSLPSFVVGPNLAERQANEAEHAPFLGAAPLQGKGFPLPLEAALADAPINASADSGALLIAYVDPPTDPRDESPGASDSTPPSSVDDGPVPGPGSGSEGDGDGDAPGGGLGPGDSDAPVPEDPGDGDGEEPGGGEGGEVPGGEESGGVEPGGEEPADTGSDDEDHPSGDEVPSSDEEPSDDEESPSDEEPPNGEEPPGDGGGDDDNDGGCGHGGGHDDDEGWGRGGGHDDDEGRGRGGGHDNDHGRGHDHHDEDDD
jgi:hypothetical protein